MWVIHSVVIREKTPSKRHRIHSRNIYFCVCLAGNRAQDLSGMKSCLWGWSCYHYSLAQRPISHRIHIFLATLSKMHLQTHLINIQLKNMLHVHMVCFLFLASATYRNLQIGAVAWRSYHARRYVRTHAHRQTRTHTLYCHETQKNKAKVDV